MYTVFDRYAGRPDRDWSAEFLKLYDDLKKKATGDRAKQERRARHRHVAVAARSRSFAGDLQRSAAR